MFFDEHSYTRDFTNSNVNLTDISPSNASLIAEEKAERRWRAKCLIVDSDFEEFIDLCWEANVVTLEERYWYVFEVSQDKRKHCRQNIERLYMKQLIEFHQNCIKL